MNPPQIHDPIPTDDLREQAIENVDRRHGYTMEFSSVPSEHAAEYDDEEQALLAQQTGSRK